MSTWRGTDEMTPHCQNQVVKLNFVKASEEGSKPETSCNVIFFRKKNMPGRI